jgi:hypothetical protein
VKYLARAFILKMTGRRAHGLILMQSIFEIKRKKIKIEKIKIINEYVFYL